MTETPQTRPTGAAQVPSQTRGQEEMTSTRAPQAHRETALPTPTGWVGWVTFAAMMMLMVGTFQIIEGLTSLFNSSYYVVTPSNLVVNVNYTAWGWTHLALGALALAAAFGVLAGQLWGRIVGIAMALVSSIVNLAFIGAYPLWSITVITLDVIVIYALAMHGREMKSV